MHLGIDLGGTKMAALLLSAQGEVCWQHRQATPQGDYAATLAALVALVQQADAHAGQRVTVGVGIPGALSALTGRVKNANSVCLIGQDLQGDLQRACQRPVMIDNDANCFALSEATDGAAAGAEVVFGVIIGTGCGGGVVVNGRVLRGANAIAGEWGHNPLPWSGAADPQVSCYCGKTGCVETYLSGPGWQRLEAGLDGCDHTAQAWAALAAAGDLRAADALARYADRLARGLASVINVLDPQVIVLGGGLSQIGALYELVPARWGRYVFSDQVVTQLKPPTYGDASGVRGAAWLGRQQG